MTEQEMQVAAAREDLCRYLAACYYEPDPAFEEEGMFAALAVAARLVDESLATRADKLGEHFRAASRDELLLDYSRLFLGPTNVLAKPYGSFWLDEQKTLMGDSTVALLDLYAEAGFEMDEEFKELPDHIAAELEFLYLLTFRENEAQAAGEDTRQWAELRRRFLTQHLGAWATRFAGAMAAGAKSAFYRELAGLTEMFVQGEKKRIRV